MLNPSVYADLQNADTKGRLRLNCVGTIQDLAKHGISLRNGLKLELYDEDHKVEGEVLFSDEEHLWVAVIDWKAIRTSEQRTPVS
jgi:hypothetical protein